MLGHEATYGQLSKHPYIRGLTNQRGTIILATMDQSMANPTGFRGHEHGNCEGNSYTGFRVQGLGCL